MSRGGTFHCPIGISLKRALILLADFTESEGVPSDRSWQTPVEDEKMLALAASAAVEYGTVPFTFHQYPSERRLPFLARCHFRVSCDVRRLRVRDFGCFSFELRNWWTEIPVAATTANSTRYRWISANRICGRWNIASPNTFLVSPGPYHGVVGVVGVVVSHGLVNEVDSEEPTRRGVVHHISVCRLNKQARGDRLEPTIWARRKTSLVCCQSAS